MTEPKTKNYFEVLNDVNVSDKIEKKNGLSYLSWAWAWGELKKRHPTANYIIYENKDAWNYFTDGKTCWVKTGVVVDGLEHIEYLPVMDYRNSSITVEKVTSFDVNKAIQRSLTKAVARHGLGLFIFAGDDLPESDKPHCECCGVEIVGLRGLTADQIIEGTTKAYGKKLCYDCSAKMKAKNTKAKEKPVEVKETKE